MIKAVKVNPPTLLTFCEVTVSDCFRIHWRQYLFFMAVWWASGDFIYISILADVQTSDFEDRAMGLKVLYHNPDAGYPNE